MSESISRREFLKTVVVSAGGLAVLAACKPAATTAPAAGKTEAPAAAPASGEAVKLTIWTWYSETDKALTAAAADYSSKTSGVTVENRTYGGGEYLQVLEAAIAGGKGPDIFGPHVHAVEYGLAGQTVDLGPALGEEFLSKFFPSTRKQFTAQGKQFALGWMAQTFGLFYTPSLFEKAGVTAPLETWDDLIAAAQKFVAAGIIPVALGNSDKSMGCDFYLPLVAQASDQPDLVYDLDDHVKDGVTWNSKPVIDALGMVDKLVKGKVFEDGANGVDYNGAVSLWFGGKSAMWYGGSWLPAGIVTDAPPALAKEYKVMKTPAWATGKPHYTGNQAGAALAIYAKGGHTTESIDFIKWLYDGARYSDIMNKSFSMPSTIEAASLVTDPVMKEMTSWLPEGVPHILFGKGSWDAVGNGVQTIFGQLKSPADAAAQVETDLVAARSK